MKISGLFPFLCGKFFALFYNKRKVAYYLVSLCDEGSFVLDVGCDDGSIPFMMMKEKPTLKIVGIDIQEKRRSKIPRLLYNGRKISYPDNHFDIVMAVDVLHHTSDIPALLKEMTRVSKKYVIIKDHVVTGFFSRCGISFTDFITNATWGIKCVYNFPSEAEWKSYFGKAGLQLIERPKNLSYGFFVNERYNPIFKLEKIKSS